MVDPKNVKLEHHADGTPSILRKAVVFKELNFYKRSDILYQLTVAFCRRFLPKYGDRTVDQMVQAARSTKQIILCDHDAQKAADLGRRIGCEFADSRTVVAESEYVFLGVKPQMMAEMLEEIKKTLKQHRDDILVSTAAGLSIKTLR